MPISLAILACGTGLLYLGGRGVAGRGIQFSKTTTLQGQTAKAVGAACLVAGAALALGGLGLIALLMSRGPAGR